MLTNRLYESIQNHIKASCQIKTDETFMLPLIKITSSSQSLSERYNTFKTEEMKELIILSVFGLIGLIYSNNSIAQDAKSTEVEFQVDGVCKMCKSRIENAANIKGVKFCEWSKETQILKVVYNSSKTDLETIHLSVSEAGHSTSEYKADSIAYNKLPTCCAYQDGAVIH